MHLHVTYNWHIRSCLKSNDWQKSWTVTYYRKYFRSAWLVIVKAIFYVSGMGSHFGRWLTAKIEVSQWRSFFPQAQLPQNWVDDRSVQRFYRGLYWIACSEVITSCKWQYINACVYWFPWLPRVYLFRAHHNETNRTYLPFEITSITFFEDIFFQPKYLQLFEHQKVE